MSILNEVTGMTSVSETSARNDANFLKVEAYI